MNTEHSLIESTGAHSFEYAYSGKSSSVLTATQVFPTLGETQALLSDVSITEAEHAEFIDTMIADWRRGAVGTFFDRDCSMGRWLQEIKSVNWSPTENRITMWIRHSSKMHTAINIKLNEHRSTDSNIIINRDAVAKFVYHSAQSIRGGVQG
jgi:hypothetical protein